MAGGGPAGFSAALSAARSGVSVTLIELGGALGGVWTQGLLSYILDAHGKSGILDEIVNELKDIQGYLHTPHPPNGSSYIGDSDWTYDSEAMKFVLEKLAKSANIHIEYHSRVVNAFVKDRLITHVVIENVLYAADPVRFPTLTLAPEVVQYNPYNTVEKRPWPVTGDYYPAGCLVRNGTDLHHAGLHIKRHVPYSTETYNYVDAALVIMNDGQFMGDGRYFVDANSYQIWQPTDLETPHTDYYPFATTEEIDELIGARCYSTGRTTGPKGYCDATTNAHLTITAVHVSAQVGFSQTIVPEFAELIQYQSPPGFETIYRASLGGDSGSALLADVVDAQTGEVRRKIVGLVFAGNGQIGLANRIYRVAETLNIRAWDASYQFTRSASLSVPTPLLITEPVATTGKYLTTTRDE